ncbi:hypothetical protein B0J17DRAFT_717490 [Rhizoctonia solani]|nr:hypothetical protein B0J17DRAFT_717490 [Rhizoctonia solani]
MSTTTGASKSKKSGIRSFLRNSFSRSSSNLSTQASPPPHITQALSSPNELRVPDVESHSSGALALPPSTVERSATPHSASVPSTLSAVPANPRPSLSPTDVPATSEPTKTTKTVTNEVWAGLHTSLQALGRISAGFPHLASAVSILLECFDVIETAARNQKDYEDLARELTKLNGTLMEHTNGPAVSTLTKCISSITMEIKHQAEEIKKKATRDTIGRLLVVKEDEEDVVRHYRRIQSAFQQLQINMSASTLSIVNEQLANTRLEALKQVEAATYDSSLSSTVHRRSCTEGTRKQVLSQIEEWLFDGDMPTVYWLNGMAGTGKTTIAYTFSERLEKRKRLAASFFCTRTSADCRNVTRIIPSIAYQLARYSTLFQSALCEVLGEEHDVGSKTAEKQFGRLLLDPLTKAKNTMPDNLVVVIDALDECEDRVGVETLLDILFRHASDMPLRFFVTSRPEPEIYARMMLDVKARQAMHLHDIEKSLVQADIELYLKEELSFVIPTASQIKQLAERSGSLFIYAATFVRYIRFGKRFADPQQRLQSVLALTPESAKKHAEIDALYTAILESALKEAQMEKNEAEDVKLVLRTVLFAQEPISVETIAILSGIDNPQRDTKLVSTLHASFPDFMLSSDRSKSFFCDIVAHSQLLAERCFVVMKEQLRFNICELESSFVPNNKVDNLKERIEQKISPTLAYACRYWGSHLAFAPKSEGFPGMLEEFVSDRLLFWMEVLSLRREMAMGLETLVKAKQWLNHIGSASPDLVLSVEDARNFVTGFAGSPVSQSTPHIYISSLPFCPRSSTVYKNYWQRTRGLLELKGSLMERRESAAWLSGTSVRKILNAHDGTLLVEPLQGHTDIVYSVAFSPDGKLLASGSIDNTIRVWNAYNGTLTAGPMQDHTGWVVSVSFSPDGKRLVYGSYDHTIRIWNAADGTLLLGPLGGHGGDYVNCVTYSPDGTLIASASYDKTIRLWKSHDGTPTLSPFEGHTNQVQSVSFTPYGSRLVSGSHDTTIRVWNTSDGSLATNPLEGHTNAVMSVAVSSDGTRVASGSFDHTVRVWNVDDGTLAAGPFIGHTREICSVAFSPDGTRVISGSLDATIRVWNVRDGLVPPSISFKDHMFNLRSTILTQSGSRILSIASDDTIWTWDVISSGITSALRNEHLSVQVFSPWSPAAGRIATFAKDHSIKILDISSDLRDIGPLYGHTKALTSFCFSVDSTQLATGSEDRTIRVWDLTKAELAAGPFHGHGGRVTSVTLSSDLSRLVSSSTEDRTIRVWNVNDAILLSTPPSESHSNVSSDCSQTLISEHWNIRDDGWVTNSSSTLLFWIPLDLASMRAWPSPHTEFIITQDGILHIPIQQLFIGDQWSKCYIPE